jgi:hypothetical protein
VVVLGLGSADCTDSFLELQLNNTITERINNKVLLLISIYLKNKGALAKELP